MDQNEVMVAFEILLEEIEAVIDGFNNEGAEAFHKGDYEAVGEIRERAKQISSFRDKGEVNGN